MKYGTFIPLFVLVFILDGYYRCTAEQLPLLGTITLPNVSGRIDHMAFDPKGNRLFIAALGNNTIEIINVRTARRIGTITCLKAPQNVLYLDEFECIVVSNAGDGTVRFFNSESLIGYRTLELSDDADNMRYDSATKQIFVGYGNGAIAIIDAEKGMLLKSIKLPGHPEAFVLEPNGKRIFVNIPSVDQVAVIDCEKMAQIAAWKVKGMGYNFPMALDENKHRLFIGFRAPARLVVLSSDTGREITMMDCIGDVDDVFYNAVNGRIYLSGGAGGIDVFNQVDADHYIHIARTLTAMGARTSLIVPECKSLYVAVPRLISRAAQIQEYGLR